YSPDLVLTQEDYLRSRQLAKDANGEGTAKVDANNLMAAADARMRLMGVSPSEVRRLESRV
ncbi:MAG: FixH family protein, partial [Candidatus Binataceae bacterium]